MKASEARRLTEEARAGFSVDAELVRVLDRVREAACRGVGSLDLDGIDPASPAAQALADRLHSLGYAITLSLGPGVAIIPGGRIEEGRIGVSISW